MNSGAFIAICLLLAVFVTPGAGMLWNALPEDRKGWAAVAWLASGVVLWFASDGIVWIAAGLGVGLAISSLLIADPSADDVAETTSRVCDECGNDTNWKALWARRRGEERAIVAWVCENCGTRQDAEPARVEAIEP